MPYNPQPQRPFNFNIDENGLIELAKVADPKLVMAFMDNATTNPATTPVHAVQLQSPQQPPDELTDAVLGSQSGSAPAPPVPLPEQAPLPPPTGSPPPGNPAGLGFQALSLLNQMNRPAQRVVAPNPGWAPRPAQIQFQQFLPAAVNTRPPDLASIIYGRR